MSKHVNSLILKGCKLFFKLENLHLPIVFRFNDGVFLLRKWKRTWVFIVLNIFFVKPNVLGQVLIMV